MRKEWLYRLVCGLLASHPRCSSPPIWPQNWCIKRRSQSIYLQVLTDKHAPEHYRSAPLPAWASPPPCAGRVGWGWCRGWVGKDSWGLVAPGTHTLWVSP